MRNKTTSRKQPPMNQSDEGTDVSMLSESDKSTPPKKGKGRRRENRTAPICSATFCNGEWLQAEKAFYMCEACRHLTSLPVKIHACIPEDIATGIFDSKIFKTRKIRVCLDCYHSYGDDNLLVQDILDKDEAYALFRVDSYLRHKLI